MKIHVCPNCGGRVVATGEGDCPSCRKPVTAGASGESSIAADETTRMSGSVDPTTSLRGRFDELAACRQLRYPAAGLLVLTPVAIILDITFMIIEWGPAAWGTLPLLLMHVLTFFGAINMVQFRSYGAARAVAIAACFPLCSPLLWLGAPFGIWALILLRDPGVRLAFGEIPEELRSATPQAEAVVCVLRAPVEGTSVMIHSGRRCQIRCNDFEDTVIINLIGRSQLQEGETASVGLYFDNYSAWIGLMEQKPQIVLLENEVPLASGTITKLLDVDSQADR